jgi:two-component system sensor histidine kinase/response regulator
MLTHDILLLGDGSHFFRTMGWVLEYKGYRVRSAATPGAAIEALVQKNFDLVIAKVSMEDLDNLALLKKAKQLNPEVKVMVISGDHQVTFPLGAYEINIDDYILMPISPMELWRRVSQCLEQVVEIRSPQVEPEAGVPGVNERILSSMMIMFHDLRGSMVATGASLKLLMGGTYGTMDEQATAKVQELYEKVKKLTDLTEEFMGQALSSQGDLSRDQESLDLGEDIIEPVLAEFAQEIRGQGITVDNQLSSNPRGSIPIRGSRLWLRSVFRNLLNNGMQYGGRGCHIAIALEKQGTDWRLVVHNRGEPVPEEYRSMLFKKIRPLGRRAGGQSDGMGLGLYLSRDIILKHGGDLRYQAQNDGSDFVVTLPRIMPMMESLQT